MNTAILDRLRQLPITESDETWEVGFIQIPIHVVTGLDLTDEEIPIVAACVSTRGGAAITESALPADLGACALLESICKYASEPPHPGASPRQHLPRVVRVAPSSDEATTTLIETMRELGVTVQETTEQYALDELAEVILSVDTAALSRLIQEELPEVPGILGDRRMHVERVRAFADAAAEFYNAEPWTVNPDEILWRIEPVPGTRALSHFTVMGGAGEEFGLGFLSSPREMLDIMNAHSPLDYLRSRRATLWSVTFDRIEGLPPEDARLWNEESLPVAGPAAYPLATGAASTGRIVRPSPRQLTCMEATLRAAARLTAEAAARGAVTHLVPAFGGRRRITLRVALNPEEFL